MSSTLLTTLQLALTWDLYRTQRQRSSISSLCCTLVIPHQVTVTTRGAEAGNKSGTYQVLVLLLVPLGKNMVHQQQQQQQEEGAII
jgi:hypothetical protein